jgi:hypothetical protein
METLNPRSSAKAKKYDMITRHTAGKRASEPLRQPVSTLSRRRQNARSSVPLVG